MTRDGKVVTRQADHGILKGITRTVVLEAIAAQGLKLEERAFTLDEAHAAREAFITSASQIVLPVVQDRRPAGRQRRARPDRVGAAARLPPLRRNQPDAQRLGSHRIARKAHDFVQMRRQLGLAPRNRRAI